MANISGTPWHGDVFKTVFAIHDYDSDFCYATQMNDGNPQTIIWRTSEQHRQKIFKDIDEISHFTYFDLLDMAWLLFPVEDDIVSKSLIGTEINPDEYKDTIDYTKLMYSRLNVRKKTWKQRFSHLYTSLLKKP